MTVSSTASSFHVTLNPNQSPIMSGVEQDHHQNNDAETSPNQQAGTSEKRNACKSRFERKYYILS